MTTGAKVEATWAALRALHEGARPTLELLARAGRYQTQTVEGKARAQGWDEGQTAKRRQRLQKQQEQLEAQMARLTAELATDDSGVTKAKVETISALMKAVEKLGEMLPASQADAREMARKGAMERNGRVARLLGRIDARILELAREFAGEIKPGGPQVEAAGETGQGAEREEERGEGSL